MPPDAPHLSRGRDGRPPITARPRLPVPASQLRGRVLHLPAGMCQYRHLPFTARVRRVREDISLWYDGEWVWIDVDELDNRGALLGHASVLVCVAALTGSRPVDANVDRA